ncbi:MAG: D-alanyl-lipoteichoic acid biosynthesis protein DltD [Liquorilactobacillus ghanensis]|uniref:D-alanyl-lipoteichoic acid biosynthesis protein DltD n=1 Tax=Liquorilactobacillus ghanensis TaxID=399370 RepID=UPI0039EA97B9
MKKNYRLWSIFGPIIIAVLLLIGLFMLPLNFKVSSKTLKEAAVSLDTATFKNQFLKKQALETKKTNYVPFFGSSELERMDRFHPSVMAAKYHNYRPFLLGKKGAQSLPQVLAMETILPQLKNRKVVFIVSPQWFVKRGITPPAFKYYNGDLADFTWLQHADPHSAYDRYFARRLVRLLGPNDRVGQMAARIAAGHKLTSANYQWISFQRKFLIHEDQLFSRFRPNENYEKRIVPKINQLPKHYNYQKLQTLARGDAQRQTTNNNFGILNNFYSTRVKPNKTLLKGAEKNFSYLKSPEYSDFELVLQQLAKQHTQVLFMIQPVNSKWADYTGLNMQMYYQTVRKIKYQLHQQGFNNIADYSHQGSTPYFMEDTIHIGWAGWVKFDKRVADFVAQKSEKTVYHLQKKFLQQNWQQLEPTQQNLKAFSRE